MSRLPYPFLALMLLLDSRPTVASPWQERAAGKQPPPAPAASSLPPGARARLGGVALRHAGSVEAVALSPDGKTLASAGQDGVLRLWDTTTAAERARFSLPGGNVRVQQLGFSPDGKVLAFTGLGQTVSLCDAATGKPLHTLKWPARNGIGPRFAFTPDGKQLLSWANDYAFRLWDVATGKQLRSFPAVRLRAVTHLIFAPDGKTLVALDPAVRLWDTIKGKEVEGFRVPAQQFYSVAVSPDGKTVATGGLHEVRLWEVAGGKERGQLPGYSRPVLALAFSPDGKALSAASDDGDWRLWRVRDGRQLRQVRLVKDPGSANPIAKLSLSADGRLLAWTAWRQHNQAQLTDLETGKTWPSGTQPSGALAAFAPDGKTVATPCADGRVRLWETATGKVVRACAGEPGPVQWLGFSPDGKTLLALGKEVISWDTATGREVRRRPAPKLRFPSRVVALSPSGTHLAIGEVDHSRAIARPACRVFLWHLEADKEVPALKELHADSVTSVAFSADGKRLASTGRDHVVRVWEVATGQEVRVVWAPEGHNSRVSFADGGQSLLAFSAYFKDGGEAFRVMRWDLATGKPRGGFEGTGAGLVNFLAVLAPAGDRLACVHQPGGVDVWQTGTGKLTHQLRSGERELAMPLAFSADGRLLATGHASSTVLLWDLSEKREKK
jgi:WD40 repeat protein